MKIKNKKIREIYEYIMSLLNDGEELLYIAGTDKLPEPLSVDEEKEMLDRLAAGDDDARKKLPKRFKTRRFRDGKILAQNDLYREF